MKFTFTLLTFFLFLPLTVNSMTLDELKDKAVKALIDGDAKAYENLVFKKKIPEKFKSSILGSIPYYKDGIIESIKTEEFTKAPEPYLLSGKKYTFEPTPIGQILIKFKSKGTNGITYGKNDSGYGKFKVLTNNF